MRLLPFGDPLFPSGVDMPSKNLSCRRRLSLLHHITPPLRFIRDTCVTVGPSNIWCGDRRRGECPKHQLPLPSCIHAPQLPSRCPRKSTAIDNSLADAALAARRSFAARAPRAVGSTRSLFPRAAPGENRTCPALSAAAARAIAAPALAHSRSRRQSRFSARQRFLSFTYL